MGSRQASGQSLKGCPQRAKNDWGVKLVNPITPGSIKCHSCEQWKEEEPQQEIEIEQGRKRAKKGKKKKKNIEIQEKH